jgi:hypothetical protein
VPRTSRPAYAKATAARRSSLPVCGIALLE